MSGRGRDKGDFEALLSLRDLQESRPAPPSLGAAQRSYEAHTQCRSYNPFLLPVDPSYAVHNARLAPKDGLAKGRQAARSPSGFQPPDSQASGKG